MLWMDTFNFFHKGWLKLAEGAQYCLILFSVIMFVLSNSSCNQIKFSNPALLPLPMSVEKTKSS